jgi:hypothetical protein
MHNSKKIEYEKLEPLTFYSYLSSDFHGGSVPYISTCITIKSNNKLALNDWHGSKAYYYVCLALLELVNIRLI